jgi:hypothetical protein
MFFKKLKKHVLFGKFENLRKDFYFKKLNYLRKFII